MVAKNLVVCISLLLVLFACKINNPEEHEALQNSDEIIAQRNETLDLDCIGSLDNPMYDQLQDQVTELIPFENYELRLLAWNSQVDDRPHYFDMALFLVKQYGENPKWLLIGMYRLPKSSDPSWHLGEETDGEWRAFQEFYSSPSADDVYLFASDNKNRHLTSFAPASGFRFIKSNVCEQTWRELISIGIQ